MAEIRPKYLAIPQDANSFRARSRTITTPLGTPTEYRSEYFPAAALQRLSKPKGHHWSRLPVELKTHVLSYLSATEKIRCSAVNREIRDIVTGGSLWQTLDTASFYSRIPATQLHRLVETASPFVQVLNLRGCSQLKSDTSLKLENLVRASFEGCRFFTHSSIKTLLAQNSRLKHLHVSGLTVVDDNVLQVMMQSCCALQSLNISYCRNVTAKGVDNLVRKLPDLQDLRIAECPLSRETMLALHGLHNVKRLSLAGCRDLVDDWIRDLIYGSITFGVVYPETRVKNSLVHLDLSRCRYLTSDTTKYLRWVLPNLEKLQLAGHQFSDAALAELVVTLPSLSHIDLEDSKISDAVLDALSTCANLRHIQLSFCPKISDAGILQLIEALPITHLDNTEITDRVLSAIAATPQPMRVSLYDCKHLSWTGVLSLLTANSARPESLKRIKTFYGWQRPVDGHTKRCQRSDLRGAKEIEKEWAAYMMTSSEQVMRTGEGRSKFLDFDDNGLRIVARERRSRACTVM